jgi:hypothetical protein
MRCSFPLTSTRWEPERLVSVYPSRFSAARIRAALAMPQHRRGIGRPVAAQRDLLRPGEASQPGCQITVKRSRARLRIFVTGLSPGNWWAILGLNQCGLRWGELAELRAGDLNLATGILTVSRSVVELDPKYHPAGERFLVKPYPKNTKYRRFKLSRQVVAKLSAHISERHLGPDDLLFTAPTEPPRRVIELPNPDTLGRTGPNAAGRRYRHGTLTGYSLGRCRCKYCKAAYAHYRAERRGNGKDDPRRGRPLDTDGYIPRGWFRERVCKPALAVVRLSTTCTSQALRFGDCREPISGLRREAGSRICRWPWPVASESRAAWCHNRLICLGMHSS